MGDIKVLVFDAAVFTDCGAYRAKNEDSFQLCGHVMSDDRRTGTYEYSVKKCAFGVAAVFDGMGGAKFGDVASAVAAEHLTNHMTDVLNFGGDGVNNFVAEANAAVCRKAYKLRAPMGSTMVLAAVSDEIAAVYNIGDSRAYIVRSGQIKQITKDHTVAASLSSIGIDKKSGNREHQLTQYLGIPPDEIVVQAFTLGRFSLRAEDRLLLCSDGVTDGLSEEQILAVLAQEKSAAELAKQAVTAAAARGSKDNMTAVVLTFSEDGKPNRASGGKGQGSQAPSGSARRDSRGGPESAAPHGDGRMPRRGNPNETFRPEAVKMNGGPASAQAAPSFSAPIPRNEAKKEKLAAYWLLNAVLALALGLVFGFIYCLA
jgi:protein phosphatase